MKFIILGNSLFTKSIIEAILDKNHTVELVVSLKSNNLPNNSIDLNPYLKKNNIRSLQVNDINTINSIQKIKKYFPDFIISTWPYILKNNFLKIPKYFVIGTHPTNLPNHRGRHPLHWLISMGNKKTKLSFFIMNKKIDQGNILFKQNFFLGNNINTANQNMNLAGYKAILQILGKIKNNNFKSYKQNEKEATYFRSRNIHDITLDPRMNYEITKRIISSFLTPNYPGARLYYDKNLFLVVCKLTKDKYEKKFNEIYEQGYVIKKSSRIIKVKFDKDIVNLYLTKKLPTKFPKRLFPPSYYYDYKK